MRPSETVTLLIKIVQVIQIVSAIWIAFRKAKNLK